MALRIVFCGTPDFAVPALRHLIAQPDFDVAGVVTQPDRPRGRGQETASPPVKNTAIEAGIAVFQPEKIKSDAAFEYFREIAPDAVVIIAYGQIISARLIEIPRLGWINVHASLLPKYRGAAPINWAIVNGDERTGLTTMRIDAGLDTGAILLQQATDIGSDETALQLTSRLAEAGAPLIAETLQRLDRGEIVPTAQDDSQATFAPPLQKRDGYIDWSLAARSIYSRIRGLQPWPGAFTSFRGKNCQIGGKPFPLADLPESLGPSDLAPRPSPPRKGFPAPGTIELFGPQILVSCGEGDHLRLEFVQLEGRKRVTAQEFVNGARLTSGESFGS